MKNYIFFVFLHSCSAFAFRYITVLFCKNEVFRINFGILGRDNPDFGRNQSNNEACTAEYRIAACRNQYGGQGCAYLRLCVCPRRLLGDRSGQQTEGAFADDYPAR